MDKLTRYSIDSKGLPYADTDGVWLSYIDVDLARRAQASASPCSTDAADLLGYIAEDALMPLTYSAISQKMHWACCALTAEVSAGAAAKSEQEKS